MVEFPFSRRRIKKQGLEAEFYYNKSIIFRDEESYYEIFFFCRICFWDQFFVGNKEKVLQFLCHKFLLSISPEKSYMLCKTKLRWQNSQWLNDMRSEWHWQFSVHGKFIDRRKKCEGKRKKKFQSHFSNPKIDCVYVLHYGAWHNEGI